MKLRIRVPLALAALLALAGCQVTTFEQSPLAALPCDPAVVGEWHSVGDEPSGDGEMILRVSADCQLEIEERTPAGPRTGDATPLFLGEHCLLPRVGGLAIGFAHGTQACADGFVGGRAGIYGVAAQGRDVLAVEQRGRGADDGDDQRRAGEARQLSLAGGVGHVAIQLAKAIGARVFTTVREANFEFARSMGADVLIDYEKEDYVDAILRETGGQGVDVVFDTIGGNTLTRSPDALAQLGRVVSIVDIAQPQNLVQAWGKNASYHFVFTRQNRGKLDELSTLLERGQLRPHVGAVYSLADLGLAHARLESRNNGLQGKIVIAVEPSLLS